MAAALMPETQPVVTTSGDGQFWIAHWNGHTYATHLQRGGLYIDGVQTLDGASFWVTDRQALAFSIRKFYSR